VQNADFLLILGSRLNIRQISFNWKSFARAAKKVMVDVDAAELAKPTLSIDLPIHSSLQRFFAAMEQLPVVVPAKAHGEYLAWCRARAERYPVVKKEYWSKPGLVNPYVFAQKLFEQLPEGEKVVTGDGTACVVTFQAAELKKGQRLYPRYQHFQQVVIEGPEELNDQQGPERCLLAFLHSLLNMFPDQAVCPFHLPG
jgi:acetolactate synthase-1/2/3 large subunit